MGAQAQPNPSRPDPSKFKQIFTEFERVTNNMSLGVDLKKSNPNPQFTIPT